MCLSQMLKHLYRFPNVLELESKNYYEQTNNVATIMDITKLSNEAFAILAQCEETRKPFGITVDPLRGNLKFVWAFKIDKAKAHREGFDSKRVHGTISLDNRFPGCQHCGEKRFYICGNCGSVVCWHGQERVTCPSCHQSGVLQTAETFDLRGGGY